MCIVNKHTHKNVYKNIHINLCILSVDYAQIFVYNTVTRSNKTDLQQQNNFIIKEVVIMCMTVKEINEAMEQIQEWKRIKEEAEDNITTLNSKVMEFLNETEECEAVDNKGKPIRRFIGNIFKATLSSVERETVNKDEVKKLLSKDDYAKVSKVSRYQSLRIN